MAKEILLPENIQLTEEVRTIYKYKDGTYYISKEGAQKKLSTHVKCECGNGVRDKFKVYCDSCKPAPIVEYKKWDGVSLLYLEDSEGFFNSLDEVYEYCDDNDIDKDSIVVRKSTLIRLVE